MTSTSNYPFTCARCGARVYGYHRRTESDEEQMAGDDNNGVALAKAFKAIEALTTEDVAGNPHAAICKILVALVLMGRRPLFVAQSSVETADEAYIAGARAALDAADETVPGKRSATGDAWDKVSRLGAPQHVTMARATSVLCEAAAELVNSDGTPASSRPVVDPTSASIEAGNAEREKLRRDLATATAENKALRDQIELLVKLPGVGGSQAEVDQLRERERALEERLSKERVRHWDTRQEVSRLANENRSLCHMASQRQKLLDDGLAARLRADRLFAAIAPLLPNGCKLDDDSICAAVDDYRARHEALIAKLRELGGAS
jgi:hypothetical protein